MHNRLLHRLLLTVLILMGAGMNYVQATIYDGKLGTNVNYSLDSESGVLTVSGTGAMWDNPSAPQSILYTREVGNYPNKVRLSSLVTSIVIESGVTSIGRYAFAYCAHCYSVEIPASVTTISNNDNYAFFGCTDLREIYVSWTGTIPAWHNMTYHYSIPQSEFLLIIPCGTRTKYEAATGWKDYTVASPAAYNLTVKTNINSYGRVKINDGAAGISITESIFCGEEATITAVTTTSDCNIDFIQWNDGNTDNPRTITVNATSLYTAQFGTIGGNCGKIGHEDEVTWSLDLCDSTLTISGTGEMKNYTSGTPGVSGAAPWIDYKECIKHVIIEEGVRSIGDYAFYQFPVLVSVSNPNSLHKIGDLACYRCHELETFNFPENLDTIGANYGHHGPFYECTSLQAIYIPAKVKIIYQDAFLRCSSATSIVVAPGNTVYDSRDNCNAIIEKGTKTLLYGCRNSVIPDGVLKVNDWAFEYQHNLQSIRISSTVKSFGKGGSGGVFKECENLKDIYVEWKTSSTIPAWNNLTQWSEHSSDNLNATIRLHVPCGMNGLYASKTGWKNYQIVDDHSKGGICGAQGSNLTWMLSCDSVLTISGTGEMKDNSSSSNQPWKDYVLSIRSVILEDGVTNIARYAFSGCSNLTSVTIPSSVTELGQYAFSGCTSLPLITIPGSVLTIGNNMLTACDALTDIYIEWTSSIPSCPSQLTNKGTPTLHVPCGTKATYSGMNGWKKYSIVEDVPNSVSGTCGAEGDNLTWSLNLCDSTLTIQGIGEMKDWTTQTNMPWSSYKGVIKAVVVEEGVTNIGGNSFIWCTKLSSVSIPESVTAIGHHAFCGCTSLTSVDLPSHVESIGRHAFESNSFTTIHLPSSLTTMGDYIFAGCKNMTDVYVAWTSSIPAYPTFTANIASITLHVPCGTTSLYQAADGWKNFTIVADVPHILSGNCGASLTWSLNRCDGTLTISGTGAMADWSNPNDVPWAKDTLNITSVSLPDGLTTIGNNAFRQCANLTSISIPNTVTSIGEYAFNKCYSLESVSMSNSVTSIGEWAFGRCHALTNIEIPNTVTAMGRSVFSYCSALTSVTIGSGLDSIPGYTFWHCTNLTSIEIPNGVTSIGRSAFYGCSSLASISLPYGLTSIGDYAFFRCYVLAGFDIPNSVTTMGHGVLSYCYALTSIVIPNSVTSMGSWTLDSCANLTSATIGSGLTSIPDYTFRNCPALTSVNIPNSVTSIGEYAFRGCSSLPSIDFPNGLISIGDYAFNRCSALTSVTIPNSVTALGNQVCNNCSSLSDVWVSWTSTIPNWSMFTNKTPQSDITLHVPCGKEALYSAAAGWQDYAIVGIAQIVNGTCGPTGHEDEVTWSLNMCDSTLTISGTGPMADWGLASNVPWYAYRNAIKTVVIEEGVTTIGARAFHSCYNLTSITIPSTVTQIGQNVFMGCPVLDNLYISDLEAWCNITMVNGASSPFSHNNTGIPTKVGNLYLNNSLVTTLVIPDGITTIKRYLFSGFCSFTTIQFNQVSSIGEYAFTCNHGIESLDIPSTVTSIDACAFSYCLRLETAILPDGLTTMSHSVLYNCYNLTSVTIPASVTSIEEYALNNCHNLTDMYVGWTSAIPAWPNYFTNKTPQSAITLHVPCGTEALYSAATGWQDYTIVSSTQIINGTCGTTGHEDEVTWSLNLCDSTLTISGTGPMIEDMFSSNPWASKRLAIKSVIIEDGVTSIGWYAFDNCKNLRSVSIPNSVTKMGFYAFRNCSTLTSVTIPNGVTRIKGSTFRNCIALTEVHLPNNCDSIGDYVFENCKALTSVTIPSSVIFMGVYTFNKCTALSSVTFENGVKMIGRYAFGDCSALPSVTIPGSVTTIGNYAFSGCSVMASVTIEEGVDTIGQQAFYKCSALQSVTIPSSVTSIRWRAFYDCNALSDIYVSWTEAAQIPTWESMTSKTPISSIRLHVPCGKEALYQAATAWKEYTIEGEGGPYTITVQTATGDMSMGTVSITEN